MKQKKQQQHGYPRFKIMMISAKQNQQAKYARANTCLVSVTHIVCVSILAKQQNGHIVLAYLVIWRGNTIVFLFSSGLKDYFSFE